MSSVTFDEKHPQCVTNPQADQPPTCLHYRTNDQKPIDNGAFYRLAHAENHGGRRRRRPPHRRTVRRRHRSGLGRVGRRAVKFINFGSNHCLDSNKAGDVYSIACNYATKQMGQDPVKFASKLEGIVEKVEKYQGVLSQLGQIFT
ncbi:hypothetical protein [Nonomuraea sp. NPDC050540]|uniref:hypothetical protein n=1 Tax=Nonomuraea sp. NPDC050540 TaxID=3364367 RepID=UPI0037947BA8